MICALGLGFEQLQEGEGLRVAGDRQGGGGRKAMVN